MDSFEDLSKSFKAALYERGQSPFYLAFVLSWIGWNWRFIVYLFFDNPNSTETIADKLDFISVNYINVYSNLWNPLWTSIVVFISGNILTLLFLTFKNISIKIKRKHIDGIQPFDEEKEKSIREQLLKEEKRINNMVIRVNNDLEIYKKNNFELKKEITEVKQKNIELEQKKIDFGQLKNELTEKDVIIERQNQQHELNVEAIKELEDENKILKTMSVLDKDIYKRKNLYKTLKNRLIIIKATYGSENKKYEVSDILSNYNKNNSLRVQASNKIFGDPDVGNGKYLIVEYSLNGEKNILKVKEGEELII